MLGSSYFVPRFVFIKCCTSTRKPTAITESSRCLSCRLVKTYRAKAGPVLARYVRLEPLVIFGCTVPSGVAVFGPNWPYERRSNLLTSQVPTVPAEPAVPAVVAVVAGPVAVVVAVAGLVAGLVAGPVAVVVVVVVAGSLPTLALPIPSMGRSCSIG